MGSRSARMSRTCVCGATRGRCMFSPLLRVRAREWLPLSPHHSYIYLTTTPTTTKKESPIDVLTPDAFPQSPKVLRLGVVVRAVPHPDAEESHRALCGD